MFPRFISGAHMNPAVTLASAVVRRLDWVKVPVYCIAQFFGAFIASAVVYGIYYGKGDTSMRSEEFSIEYQLISLLLWFLMFYAWWLTSDILNQFPALFPGCCVYWLPIVIGLFEFAVVKYGNQNFMLCRLRDTLKNNHLFCEWFVIKKNLKKVKKKCHSNSRQTETRFKSTETLPCAFSLVKLR